MISGYELLEYTNNAKILKEEIRELEMEGKQYPSQEDGFEIFSEICDKTILLDILIEKIEACGGTYETGTR